MASHDDLNETILDPLFPPDVAARILDFSLPEDTRRRLEQLRGLANEGVLSASERAEYEQLVETLDLLAELRATAAAAEQRRAS